MRVVHINKSDTTGGASVAAARLVDALNRNNVEAVMLVAEKKGEGKFSFPIEAGFKGKAKLAYRFFREIVSFVPHEKNRSTRFAFSTGEWGFDISRHPLIKSADIIHLHWINHGFLSIDSLKALFNLGKPVVWTLHDMWSFTGGCHYSGTCKNFQKECCWCPFLNNPGERDISALQHQRKKTFYKDANLYVVTCSDWLGLEAKSSSLLNGKNIITIPNPIETSLYKPKSRDEVREQLGIPGNRKVILFGAANVSDTRKGMKHLVFALNHLAKHVNTDDVELFIFGKAPKFLTKKFPFPARSLDYITSQDTLINLYNAADVFVLPSLEDNLPNTVMEALACGLPVAAFLTGGVPEMVVHGESGFLAKPGDNINLAEGIYQVLFDEQSVNYRVNARLKAVRDYSPAIVALKYRLLYKSILENENGRG